MLASLKLIDLVANSAEPIARQWAKDVVKNYKTPFFRDMDQDKIIPQATDFYLQLSKLFTVKDPFEAIRKFIGKYAEELYHEGIPLNEAIYSVILMRRHIWLYAEFQAIFISAVEQHQAMDSLTRTILMFDYVVFALAEKYEALMRSGLRKK